VDDAERIELRQRLPFPGKLRLEREAALAEAEAAVQDFAAVRLRLAAMASLLFDAYYLAERSVEINAEHVELLEEFRRIATARYEAGAGSQQDPLQAEVEHAHATHRQLELETEARVVREQINVLLHRGPDSALPPPPERLEAQARPAIEEAALHEEALRERPELRAAEARVRAGEARVGRARREFLPDFELTGAYDRIWQERDLQPFVGLSLNIPLRVERRRAALEEARAELERARQERDALADEAAFSVQSSLDRLHEAEHVLGLFEDRLVPAARDQVDAARAGFESGRQSFLGLIDAERSLRNAELGLEESRAGLSRRRTELLHAIGRTAGLPDGGEAP
jgi:outer membrane protein TolC